MSANSADNCSIPYWMKAHSVRLTGFNMAMVNSLLQSEDARPSKRRLQKIAHPSSSSYPCIGLGRGSSVMGSNITQACPKKELNKPCQVFVLFCVLTLFTSLCVSTLYMLVQ